MLSNFFRTTWRWFRFAIHPKICYNLLYILFIIANQNKMIVRNEHLIHVFHLFSILFALFCHITGRSGSGILIWWVSTNNIYICYCNLIFKWVLKHLFWLKSVCKLINKLLGWQMTQHQIKCLNWNIFFFFHIHFVCIFCFISTDIVSVATKIASSTPRKFKFHRKLLIPVRLD